MPRPVAFTDEGVDYKAFPEQGSYFGVGTWEGRQYLAFVPMLVDGSPDTYEGKVNTGEVSNMHEAGDEQVLAEINAEFGTTFRQADFAGR